MHSLCSCYLDHVTLLERDREITVLNEDLHNTTLETCHLLSFLVSSFCTYVLTLSLSSTIVICSTNL